jgi:hypothetical protein
VVVAIVRQSHPQSQIAKIVITKDINDAKPLSPPFSFKRANGGVLLIANNQLI